MAGTFTEAKLEGAQSPEVLCNGIAFELAEGLSKHGQVWMTLNLACSKSVPHFLCTTLNAPAEKVACPSRNLLWTGRAWCIHWRWGRS